VSDYDLLINDLPNKEIITLFNRIERYCERGREEERERGTCVERVIVAIQEELRRRGFIRLLMVHNCNSP
jgi:phage host-nuclease inhibitor protein Gam